MELFRKAGGMINGQDRKDGGFTRVVILNLSIAAIEK